MPAPMKSYEPEQLARFGRYILQRRLQLGLRQEDIRAAGGPSPDTLTKYENPGENTTAPRESTLTLLDAMLRWAPGSARAVLDGGEPAPLGEDEPLPERVLHNLRECAHGLLLLTAELAELASDDTDPELSRMSAQLSETAVKLYRLADTAANPTHARITTPPGGARRESRVRLPYGGDGNR